MTNSFDGASFFLRCGEQTMASRQSPSPLRFRRQAPMRWRQDRTVLDPYAAGSPGFSCSPLRLHGVALARRQLSAWSPALDFVAPEHARAASGCGLSRRCANRSRSGCLRVLGVFAGALLSGCSRAGRWSSSRRRSCLPRHPATARVRGGMLMGSAPRWPRCTRPGTHRRLAPQYSAAGPSCSCLRGA